MRHALNAAGSMLLTMALIEGIAWGARAPDPFDPALEASIAAPARFVIEVELPEAESAESSGGELLATPTRMTGAVTPEELVLGDSDAVGLVEELLGAAPLELDARRATVAPLISQSSVLDHSAPLEAGVSLVNVPLSQRLMLSGRSWQREWTPGGLRSTSFGAEAQVGLSERVDFRMGYELMQTGPGSFGIDPGQSDDSLYAQFKFKF